MSVCLFVFLISREIFPVVRSNFWNDSNCSAYMVADIGCCIRNISPVKPNCVICVTYVCGGYMTIGSQCSGWPSCVVLQWSSPTGRFHRNIPASAPEGLNYLPSDKMTAIVQAAFSNAFLWMKRFMLWFEFHWILFLKVQLAINQHWFRQWFGAEQATSHCLN